MQRLQCCSAASRWSLRPLYWSQLEGEKAAERVEAAGANQVRVHRLHLQASETEPEPGLGPAPGPAPRLVPVPGLEKRLEPAPGLTGVFWS